ncbi:hypothetical protein [Chengkuizengella axinellae]|uniref:Uncharacterized protein n=1 Tax=Chengkuizengella axinellae TaxID=3064388 RepID=A0ABT9IZH4_9BACL|nr:hypothetical protein [Chengkuizengella sp. 2205SS18-9]MDP5274762.1 hypothetical protein [Chengkuizengella sp. 2205SS18-9]
MKEKKAIKVTPEDFGNVFLNGGFSTIYHQTTEELKQLVTIDEFIELGQSFNHGIETYNLEMSSNLDNNIKHYIWLDSERKKAITVSFDESNIIHGLLINHVVSYPESDRQYTQNTYIMPIKEEWFVFLGRDKSVLKLSLCI